MFIIAINNVESEMEATVVVAKSAKAARKRFLKELVRCDEGATVSLFTTKKRTGSRLEAILTASSDDLSYEPSHDGTWEMRPHANLLEAMESALHPH